FNSFSALSRINCCVASLRCPWRAEILICTDFTPSSRDSIANGDVRAGQGRKSHRNKRTGSYLFGPPSRFAAIVAGIRTLFNILPAPARGLRCALGGESVPPRSVGAGRSDNFFRQNAKVGRVSLDRPAPWFKMMSANLSGGVHVVWVPRRGPLSGSLSRR